MPEEFFVDDKNSCFKEAVCVNASRIYDSCSDKDCLEDLRVFFTDESQVVIDNATSVKCKDVEILNVSVDVESIPFNKGYYAVDLTYYFLIKVDVYNSPSCAPIRLDGVATFTKKVILFGSEGRVNHFTSDGLNSCPNTDECCPRAVVQVADPICLGIKLSEHHDNCSCNKNCGCHNSCCCCECIPAHICCRFEGNFGNCKPKKMITVSLGVFSIVHLERCVSMLIPAYDFCIPNKECCEGAHYPGCDDPCELFKKIKFPVDEFFPPKAEC